VFDFLPKDVQVTEKDLANTPPAVLKLLFAMAEEIARLNKRIEELEAKLAENSSNSNKPPSSNSPYKENTLKKKTKAKRKKRKGHRQQLMDPTETRKIFPSICSCGCTTFKDIEPYYTHQHIELPEIVLTVIHFILHRGTCAACGKVSKGYVPNEYSPGFGARFSALVAELGGIDGNSRETIQTFCSSVLKVHVSRGVIQKIIDRASEAIKPHYGAIRDKARSQDVNHLDETTWKKNGKLHWLWVMANTTIAFFMVHPHRSQEAFDELIGTWQGILISDGYRIYQKWFHQRQTCLAHLIRRAKGLSERKDPELAGCGKWGRAELRRLCKMAKDPPTEAEWRTFYARLCRFIALYRDSDSDAGKFVRHLESEMDSLFTFLVEEGVDPTNNFAERMIRFAVLWRKRSYGTKSDKGNRWVERILSLRQTCRLQGKSTFEVLVDAMTCYFKDQEPDLEWIRLAG
jgi:transposase